MKSFVVAIALAVSTSAIAAADSMEVATSLGSVLASEEPCGLSYDHAAIERYIEKNVKADDMGFAGMLNMMTSGSAYSIKEMSPSAMAAHCAQIRRVAKSFGFTQ